MKKCPYCAEKIQNEAILCRYCGRDIPQTNSILGDGGTKNPISKRKGLGISRILFSFIGIALICFILFVTALVVNSNIKDKNNKIDIYSLAFSPDGKRIAFISYKQGGDINGGDIYVMNIDGSGFTRLTYDAHARLIKWSPDGRWIAYEYIGKTMGYRDVYVLKTDGERSSTPVKLTYFHEDGSTTSGRFMWLWSPNSDMIAFCDDGIFINTIDGNNVVKISDASCNFDHQLAWFSDGNRIAFSTGDTSYVAEVSNPESKYLFPPSIDGHDDNIGKQILLSSDNTKMASVEAGYLTMINSDGGGRVDIYYEGYWVELFDISPDGDKLVYRKLALSGNNNNDAVYIINTDGSQDQFITDDPYITDAIFSPNGDSILFVATASAQYEHAGNSIFTIRSDGLARIDLYSSPNGTIIRLPFWSPDGKMVAFYEGGQFGGWGWTYLMNSDGSNLKTLMDMIRPLDKIFTLK